MCEPISLSYIGAGMAVKKGMEPAKPAAPPPVLPPPKPAEVMPETKADAVATQAADDERRRRAAADSKTNLTGGLGAAGPANVQKATLLGN